MPYGVAVTADGARIAVTSQQSGKVALLDRATRKIVTEMKVGEYPEGPSLPETA